MIQKIKNTILIAAMAILPLGAPVAVQGIAAADCVNNINQGINAGTNAAFSGSTCDTNLTSDSSNSIAQIAKTAINVLSLVVGILAVIMIVYGGFRYITSGGSSEGVSSAKNVIIYAIIGLVIVALAQVIVHFVLNAAIYGNVNANG